MHNFPEYFTEEGFEQLDVNNQEQNPSEVKPVYYYLEDYWTPVYQDNGEQAFGENGGKLYVYYNTNEYFENNSSFKEIFDSLSDDSNENKIVSVKMGEGFAQGIFLEYGICEDDDVCEIRNGGFGSTTK